MDAFFASVEMLDHRELQNKPVAVGGGEKRGVVATANYKAREYGVRSAMNGFKAKQLCPEIVFLPPRIERYREISIKIREIFYQYTDLVEPVALDEVYLDVTTNKMAEPSATKIAKEIRQKIFEKTGLTASAGISVNKFLAKVASNYNKPNGQKTVTEKQIEGFLKNLEIDKFYGVGRVTAEKMRKMGIEKGEDLKAKDIEFLVENFGEKKGVYFYNIARGIHTGEVQPKRDRKSIGVEYTFDKDLTREWEMEEKILKITEELHKRMKKEQCVGRRVTLKIKYADFTIKTRSRTLQRCVESQREIEQQARQLFFKEKIEKPVRLMGICISNLRKKGNNTAMPMQLELNFDGDGENK